jgi:predicted phosphodiesterase
MARRRTTRRSFLKVAGAAALAGLGGGSCTDGEPEPPKDSPQTPPDILPADSDNAAALLKAPEALFRPTASGCTVHWVPNGSVDARILAGPDADRLQVIREASSADPTEVSVDAFGPDADVYVQCQFRRKGRDEWLSRPPRQIRTTRPAGQSFRVGLIADSHVYFAHRFKQHMRNLYQTNARVMADRPDFVIFLGDEAGVRFTREREYMTQQRALERWNLWRRAFAPLLASVPSYLVLGNHEGEAGFYQAHRMGGETLFYQRWGTIARKRYCLNPLPDTYPEGGENEGWSGGPDSDATGGAAEGNCSPLQNYYAWTWGDALFVVLDVHRYTNGGGATPRSVEDWTLGKPQLHWLEHVLLSTRARWKIVIAHHLVGGYAWDLLGETQQTNYVYGRGGARYALVGEQAQITDIMKRAGAQVFLYGHDHVFAHQQAEGIHFVCCGRPTFLNPRWWNTPGWKEAYGDVSARNPHDFYAALGYVRLTISPHEFNLDYIRTGTDTQRCENVTQPEGETVYSFTLRA